MRRRNFIQVITGTLFLIAKPIKLKAVEILKKVTTPPGSKSQQNLLDNCIKCNRCIDNCPNEVLQPSDQQYGKDYENVPYLDFSTGFCSYDCNECSSICPTDAIMELPLKKKQITQIGVAKFNEPKCIVITNKSSCGACAEVCPTSAITLKDIDNNLEIPEINIDLCIGCGACEYACPVKAKDAIFTTGFEKHTEATAIENKIITTPPKTKDGKTFAF